MLKKINLMVLVVFAIVLSGCDKQEDSSGTGMKPKFHNLSPEEQAKAKKEADEAGNGPSVLTDSSGTPVVDGSGENVVASSDLEKNVKDLPGGGFVIEGMPVHRQSRPDPFDGGRKPEYSGAYCGVVSLQMVMAYHGKKIKQDDLAFTKQNGDRIPVTAQHKGQMYLRGVGTDHTKAAGVAKHFGMKNSSQRSYNNQREGIAKLKELIKKGRPQIINIDGKISYKAGYPTANNSAYSRVTKGHVIVLKGFTGSGDAIVNDPAMGSRIMTKASFERLWSANTLGGRDRLNSIDVAP
ncbi:MAG: hypothetical protein COB02_10155 [Candidatus Cloacimonadota bacterium]|nr:MAG: hypothetical protein COB02_10155 [Candidatus Cloacimonadota bacterium]